MTASAVTAGNASPSFAPVFCRTAARNGTSVMSGMGSVSAPSMKSGHSVEAEFDMLEAQTALAHSTLCEYEPEVMRRRQRFLAKWRLKCRGVADSLEEAGDGLFTFTRLPISQWKSVRTTNAIERLHEEFKRRIKTQTVLPSAETAAMLFWSLLAAGQITMRKVDGWQSFGAPFSSMPLDLAA